VFIMIVPPFINPCSVVVPEKGIFSGICTFSEYTHTGLRTIKKTP